MKYFIISIAVAGIYLCIQPQGSPTNNIASDGSRPVCVANISAGALCHPATQAQQQFVLVRGQLVPL